jgi:NitT/TauT family transport system ATP-binding protein
MDEPFSQVDALTAEGLRAEVVDIWRDQRRRLRTVVMVSHDISEVAFMADRIVVLSANPGRIRTIVENKLPRPRDARSPEYLWLLDHLHNIVTSAELPDVTVTTVSQFVSSDLVEPLPAAPTENVLGLLEYLDRRSGSSDLYQVAHDTHGTFEETLTTVKGAEMLGFVDTPQRFVLLTPLGYRFVHAPMEERVTIWRERILRLRLFQAVLVLFRVEGRELSRDRVVGEIAQRLPREDATRVFETLVAWGRFGDLFTFTEAAGVLAGPEESQAGRPA